MATYRDAPAARRLPPGFPELVVTRGEVHPIALPRIRVDAGEAWGCGATLLLVAVLTGTAAAVFRSPMLVPIAILSAVPGFASLSDAAARAARWRGVSFALELASEPLVIGETVEGLLRIAGADRIRSLRVVLVGEDPLPPHPRLPGHRIALGAMPDVDAEGLDRIVRAIALTVPAELRDSRRVHWSLVVEAEGADATTYAETFGVRLATRAELDA